MTSPRRELLVLCVLALVIAVNAWWWAGSSGPNGPADSGTSLSAQRLGIPQSDREPALPPTSSQQEARSVPAASVTVAGRVVRLTDGEPIAGALLSSDSDHEELRTNQEGFFERKAPRPPSFLSVQHPDYTTVTFILPDLLPSFLRLPLPDRTSFSGKLVDSQTGKALSDGTLTVSEPEKPPLGSAGADSDGVAVLPLPPLKVDLRSGRDPRRILNFLSLQIHAEAPEHQPVLKWATVRNFETGTQPILIPLEPIMRRAGLVVDPQGNPVPFARVFWSLLVRKGLFSSKSWQATIADEQGRFTWSGPRVLWETILVAWGSDYAPGWVRYRAFELSEREEVVLTLSQACTFRGRIVNEKGEGLAKTSVKLCLKDHPQYWNNVEFLISRFLQRNFFCAETAEGGSVELPGLPPGTYLVRWIHPTLAASRQGQRTCTLPQREPWTGVCVEGQSLEGVLITENGEPVSHGRIFLRVWEPGIANDWLPVEQTHVTYDGKGGFRCSGLEDAPHLLRASAGGFASEVRRIENFTERVVCILKPRHRGPFMRPAHLLFSVTSEGAKVDLSWVNAWLAPSGTNHWHQARMQIQRGRGIIERIEPGTYDLLISPYGYAPVTLEEVTAPNTELIPIKLKAVPFIRGRVQVLSGARPRFLKFLDSRGRQLQVTEIDGQGGVLIPGLAPGSYRCVGTRDGEVTHESPTEVLVDPPDPVSITLVEVNEKKKNSAGRALGEVRRGG